MYKAIGKIYHESRKVNIDCVTVVLNYAKIQKAPCMRVTLHISHIITSDLDKVSV